MIEILQGYPNGVRMAERCSIDRPAVEMKVRRLSCEKQQRLVDRMMLDAIELAQLSG